MPSPSVSRLLSYAQHGTEAQTIQRAAPYRFIRLALPVRWSGQLTRTNRLRLPPRGRELHWAGPSRGASSPIPTPFTADGRSVDEDALRRVVRHVVDGGHGIMTTGGTGEFPHLLARRAAAVAEVVADETDGAVPIFAGTALFDARGGGPHGGRCQRGRRRGDPRSAFYFLPDEMLYRGRRRGRGRSAARRRLQQSAVHGQRHGARP